MDYRDLVRQTYSALRAERVKAGLLQSLAVALVLFGMSGALALTTSGRSIWVLFVSLAGVLLLFTFLLRVLLPFLSLPKDRKILGCLEAKNPGFQGRLLLADYLETESEESARLGYSEELREEVLAYARSIPESDLVKSPAPAEVWKAWRLLIASLLIADLLALSFRPDLFMSASRSVLDLLTRRLVQHVRPVLLVQSPDRSARDSKVKISVSASGLGKAVPVYHSFEPDGTWRDTPMRKESSNRYSNEVSRLVRSTTFCVSAGSTITRPYSIQVLDPPRVESFGFNYRFPKYTGLEPRSEKRLDGNLAAPTGSHIDLEILVNNPLERGFLAFENGPKIPLALVGDRNATASFSVESSSRYQILLKDAYGLELSHGVFYQVVAKADQPPSISFIAPSAQVMDIPESMQVSVKGQAEDDYGLIRAELVYQIGYDRPELFLPLDLKPLSAKDDLQSVMPRSAEVALEWDLRKMDLLPGESVSYWLRAFDNDAPAGSKEGKSGVQLLRFPSMFEIYEEAQEKELAQVNTAEDVLQQQKDLRKRTEDLRETIQNEADKPEEPVSWENKETVKDLKTRQEEIQNKIESLKQDYQKSVEQIKEDSAVSSDTFEKMAKIQDLMDQMLSKEMKETLQRFNQAMDQMTAQKMDQNLANLDFSMEKFEKSLDRTLSLLEQSYLERSVERLSYKADQLAKTQQELLNRTEQRPADQTMDDLSRRQEKLQQSAEEFIKEASALAKIAEDAKNTELQKKLEQAVQQAQQDDLQKSLEGAKKSLSEGKKNEAVEEQKKAKETLDKMKASLDESKMCMSGGKSITFDVENWMRLLDRAFSVSEGQEEFDHSLPPGLGTAYLSKSSLILNHFAVLESVYAQECDRIANQVQELAAKNPFIDVQVTDLLQNTGKAMRQWSNDARDALGGSLSQQSKENLSLINMAIAKMLEVLDEMSSMSSQSSMEGYFQMLQQIIQQQGQINEMTKRLDGTNRDQPSWMEEMQRLGSQQRMVRQAMEQMRKKYQHAQDVLGDLSELGKEMKEVEDQLQQQQTGSEVQQKQERLMQRLLDAEKSVREQKDDKKRKAETAKEYTPEQSPEKLDDAKSLLRKKALENKARLNREKILPEYSDLLKNYFQRISEAK